MITSPHPDPPEDHELDEEPRPGEAPREGEHVVVTPATAGSAGAAHPESSGKE